MKVTVLTSGSTDTPKHILHNNKRPHIESSIKEIGLTADDRGLDVFPANVIAHYTVTAMPALLSGAHLVSAAFDPYTYITFFNQVQPTYISLIPRHWEILSKTKGWKDFDMSCVRYMVTGSSKISQQMIDDFRERGVKTVANWYGMTEFPPPVMIGYNSTVFDLNTIDSNSHHVMFHPITATSNLAECIINGRSTGDIFNLDTKEFPSRRVEANGNTWKT